MSDVQNGEAAVAAQRRFLSHGEVDGAEGRSRHFRPPRYSAAELAPLRVGLRIQHADRAVDCRVICLSQTGASLAWPFGASPALGEALAATLCFGEYELVLGPASVRSVRLHAGETLIGIGFGRSILDMDALLHLRLVKSWKTTSHLGLDRSQKDLPDRFKASVADFQLLLEDARTELSRLESDLHPRTLQVPEAPARLALVQQLREGFVARVLSLNERIDAALRDVPGGHCNPAAKQWSLRHGHQELMESPLARRARDKPLGYAGDFQVMSFIHERPFEGDSLFARAVTLALTQVGAARAVRARKDLVKRYLKTLLSNDAHPRPLRILAVASGSAQELIEALTEAGDHPRKLEVVLLEQNREALAHACTRLSTVTRLHPRDDRVNVVYLNDSINRLLRDEFFLAPYGQFDLVYSCGLYDYLQHRTAMTLTRRLAHSAAGGGCLLISNMIDHSGRWLMEHHLDWPLIYRTRNQMFQIGEEACPNARLSLLEEDVGVNVFLRLVPG